MGCCKTKDAHEIEFYPAPSPKNLNNQLTFGNFRRDSKNSFKTLGNSNNGQSNSKNNFSFAIESKENSVFNQNKVEPSSPRFYFSANPNYFSNREVLDKKLLGIKNFTDEENSSKVQLDNINEGNNYMSNFSLKNDIENMKFVDFANQDDLNMFSTKFGDINTGENNENKSLEASEEEKKIPNENFKEDEGQEQPIERDIRMLEESKSHGNQLDQIPVNESLNTRLLNVTKKLYKLGSFKKQGSNIRTEKEKETGKDISNREVNTFPSEDDFICDLIIEKSTFSKQITRFSLKDLKENYN